MILFDISNIFYKSYYSLDRQIKNDIEKNGTSPFTIDHDILLKSILKDVEFQKSKFESEYGDVVLCCDSSSNWRYKYFKQYKQVRKETKQNSDTDWDSIMDIYNKVKQTIADNTKYTVIEVEDLEADDIIALLCKFSKKPTLIISVDKDLNQLVKNNIHQYSPLKDEFVSRDHHPLNEAILTGDSGDGVPNIFSDDDHYVKENKIRAKSVSAKMKEYFNKYDVLTEQCIIDFIDEYNNTNKEPLDKDRILHNFNRNKMMIDLECIPENYINIFKDKFILAYNRAKLNIDKSDNWIRNLLDERDNNEITVGDLFD